MESQKSKPISKIDYDNVVRSLYLSGFKPENQMVFIVCV